MLALADTFAICFSCFFTYFIVNLSDVIHMEISQMYGSILLYLVCCIVGLIFFGVYDNMWRYANIKDFAGCLGGITMGIIAYYVIGIVILSPFSNIYNTLNYLLTLSMIVGMRIVYRYIYDFVTGYVSKEAKSKTMIVGAGLAGTRILSEMYSSDCQYHAICFVDDEPNKINRSIHGVKVLGPTSKIPEICRQHGIQTILFAIPSCEDEQRKRILNICSETECEVKIIPFLHEIIAGASLLHQVQNIKIEDLLGRKAITFDNLNVADLIADTVCMVTGGGGSIGSELCRQIAQYHPKQLIVVDIYENNAYAIQQELLRTYKGVLNLSIQIASVRDFNKMDCLIRKFRPEIIFHAAAHKHVPLMETNPEESVKNNVIGTFNIANLADLYQVKKMILISTDKAVNPTNVMGATKRCCEMIMQYMSQQSTYTEFVAVRFGNVLGSNGSVIPLFRKQIEEGGPVTVTHPDIIRYFMTIPEAVSLVLQAGSIARGGEIFVLDMGKPVKITTLAENLIRLYGYEPYSSMKIEFSGLRPGEKLFEELLMDEEGLKSTLNEKIFIGKQIAINPDQFIKKLVMLKSAAESNQGESVISALSNIVPTFLHNPLETEQNTKAVEAKVAFHPNDPVRLKTSK